MPARFIISRGYAETILHLIASASGSVDIAMYQWTVSRKNPPHKMQQINLALKDALTRGVKVRVLLHTGNVADKIRVVNERTARQLTQWGAQVKHWRAAQTLHSKLVIVDRSHALIGSHNFSLRSMHSNIESSVCLTGGAEVRPVQDYFNLLFRQA